MGNVSLSNQPLVNDDLKINGRPFPTSPRVYGEGLMNIGAGWADENIFGLGLKYYVDATVNENDT